MTSQQHTLCFSSVDDDAILAEAQLSLAGCIRKHHCLSCCQSRKCLFSASLTESLGHHRVKCPLFCLYNIRGTGALISIKRAIGLNYLYDCPLELLSMLFSLSGFSKPLPARSLCEGNTMQAVQTPQKGIALESHTSAV